jgi:hypothetical protein
LKGCKSDQERCERAKAFLKSPGGKKWSRSQDDRWAGYELTDTYLIVTDRVSDTDAKAAKLGSDSSAMAVATSRQTHALDPIASNQGKRPLNGLGSHRRSVSAGALLNGTRPVGTIAPSALPFDMAMSGHSSTGTLTSSSPPGVPVLPVVWDSNSQAIADIISRVIANGGVLLSGPLDRAPTGRVNTGQIIPGLPCSWCGGMHHLQSPPQPRGPIQLIHQPMPQTYLPGRAAWYRFGGPSLDRKVFISIFIFHLSLVLLAGYSFWPNQTGRP